MFRSERVTAGQRASDQPPAVSLVRQPDPVLEAVLAHETISVLFQPQIDPVSGEIAGVEALARWEHAESAEELFGRAAAAGLAERLSRLVQRKALRLAARWDGPLRHLRVSVNVLPDDLARPSFEEWFLSEIADSGIDPRRVTVEITESEILADLETVGERLARIRQVGVSVALDDFGTGYASLAYLAGLPLDALKLDRGLIARIAGRERDQMVVKGIIRLARELGLVVIVEGVESTAQLSLLAEWGCDLYQGFLGAGPLDEEELARFVAVTQR